MWHWRDISQESVIGDFYPNNYSQAPARRQAATLTTRHAHCSPSTLLKEPTGFLTNAIALGGVDSSGGGIGGGLRACRLHGRVRRFAVAAFG